MIDNALIEQVKNIFSSLDDQYTLAVEVDQKHPNRQELLELLEAVASTSDHLSLSVSDQSSDLRLHLFKGDKHLGITFRAVPVGHEFTTLLLAILNADGKGKNWPDEAMRSRIAALRGPIRLRTYISLSCTNCPDIVQALNIICLLHPDATHEIVDGAINSEEADALRLQGVPAVFAANKMIHSGRGGMSALLEALTKEYGVDERKVQRQEDKTKDYDVLIAGGGPAGSAAAIYSARKGLRVALVAERIGGQVKDTVAIENLISIPQTTGSDLAANLRIHLEDYPIDIFEERRIEECKLIDGIKEVKTSLNETLRARALIIATGASWRRLGIPGENEYIGHGVAFCPHCDGPFYQGKRVAVVGGGNSGIEAAIDLAGICQHVTVLEFLPELKADQVLQNKLLSLGNVDVLTNQQTLEVVGDQNSVIGIRIKDRSTDNESLIPLDGIFVQIGLSPNSSPFASILDTERGEIKIDEACRTNIPGIYAAGDVSTIPYKQIVIAMGEGAKASLSAFEDWIRGTDK